MADVFNLLSLFFMTIGKTRECPATYSQIASMRVSWPTVRRIPYIPCVPDGARPLLMFAMCRVANSGPHERIWGVQ